MIRFYRRLKCRVNGHTLNDYGQHLDQVGSYDRGDFCTRCHVWIPTVSTPEGAKETVGDPGTTPCHTCGGTGGGWADMGPGWSIGAWICHTCHGSGKVENPT